MRITFSRILATAFVVVVVASSTPAARAVPPSPTTIYWFQNFTSELSQAYNDLWWAQVNFNNRHPGAALPLFAQATVWLGQAASNYSNIAGAVALGQTPPQGFAGACQTLNGLRPWAAQLGAELR